jgi:DNA modification methylase
MKNQVFLMDCMEYMKTIEDNYYDLSICDPPYSEACNLHGGSSKNKTHGWGDNWRGHHLKNLLEYLNIQEQKIIKQTEFTYAKNQLHYINGY